MDLLVKNFEHDVKFSEYKLGNLIKNFESNGNICDVKHATRQESQCTQDNIEAVNKSVSEEYFNDNIYKFIIYLYLSHIKLQIKNFIVCTNLEWIFCFIHMFHSPYLV